MLYFLTGGKSIKNKEDNIFELSLKLSRYNKALRLYIWLKLMCMGVTEAKNRFI